MDYIIEGGRRLSGEIAVCGAKNCALPLLGASVLTDEQIVLHNCPAIVDVFNMLELLKAMGKSVFWQGDTVTVSEAHYRNKKFPRPYFPNLLDGCP